MRKAKRIPTMKEKKMMLRTTNEEQKVRPSLHFSFFPSRRSLDDTY